MSGHRNLVDLVAAHASAFPDRPAVVFSADPTDPGGEEVLTYGQLLAHAQALGAVLRSRFAVGDRILLLYGPGSAFAVGFLGTLCAGMIAVPAPQPDGYQRQRDRLARVARDSGAVAILTDRATEESVRAWAEASGLAQRVPVLVTDRPDQPAVAALEPLPIEPRTVAFLQYTSGSTWHPKGVQIDHGNMLATCRAFQGLVIGEDDRIGGWLPMYHDFGLVGQLLLPLFIGCRSVLMPPSAFLRRPHTWLRLIDRHGISLSSAPNFAYELCTRRITDKQLAGVDLSRWRVAINGSEPIQAHTLRAFASRFAPWGLRPDAVRPGYGMAEATLCLTGATHGEPTVIEVDAAKLESGAISCERGGEGRRRDLVSSGPTVEGIDVRVVDPDTRRTLPDELIGEIWVRGASVSRGYWAQPEETARVFGVATAEGAQGFLRTGDLGALRHGQLYVTGRIKELLIVSGRNLYPQDLEADAHSAHGALATGVGAAFMVDVATGAGPAEEELVVAHECRPGAGGARALVEATAAVREVLRREYGLPASVVLVRPGTVPRTTSGKIQRGLAGELFRTGQLGVLWEGLTPKVRRRYRSAGDASPAFTTADQLDRLLGDPSDRRTLFSHAGVAELDAAEAFPADICQQLDRLGLPAYYVPARYGGKLRDLAELASTVRVVARRDLTVAIAHAKTFLGACSVWVAGEPEQAEAVAAAIRRGAVVSWALTEPDHGSDLLSGEVSAVPGPDGYRIDGTKTLINNATRSDLLCVAVRTAPEGGPRGFSLVLVDKKALAAGAYRCLPKHRTHGIRGADISGITFDGAVVPADALVGRAGDGLEVILKALQVTRTACVALSLGAADHALALAHSFANERSLYGGRLSDLPDVRRRLGESYARLFAAEAVGAIAARSVHTAGEQLSVISAVAKSFVPTVVDDLVTECGGVLGARAFLTEGSPYGLFQKVARDHRIVGIFDGSTFVNQDALINQFRTLARHYRAGPAAVDDTLAVTADLRRELPDLDLSRLTLAARSGCDLVGSLPGGAAAVADLASAGVVRPALVDLAADLALRADALHAEMAAHRSRTARTPAEAFDLAGRYEVVFAAAAAIQLWLHNHRQVDQAAPLWRAGLWLEASLSYLLGRLCPAQRPPSPVFEELFTAVDGEDHAAASILSTGLAE